MFSNNYFKETIISRDLNITDIANYTGISLSKISAVLEGKECFSDDELYLLEIRLVKHNCSCIRRNSDISNQIFKTINYGKDT